ncbi:16S rRNA (guanine(527)-N(7))-methyltransferase RsmG [Cohnella lubricantis]|uniref:Ribosomal RNA small subunit methyltransferase G n=1 Tax=Cohnella lubricantis TaxID=2163172 RepID=A0A841TE25_9BACL|nr:16S rRNA (guanine(527)-N(7))-methyltransferase RsmG [Cohnella lubricantis]MBB6678239.1 16S rRNA (guanine(527)-N(7))-methyltransferase RsmG [Cohnella lubricantis]MBP2120094.1 16S rRNA (guanine527-N7)-methyltransferase [Cohnella lubricantis]
MDSVQQWFQQQAEGIGIALSERQLDQFETYYKLLVEWNEKMNLTGITEREAVYEKHFYDSLTVSLAVDMKGADSLADIGSGAGFPGLPLKIAFPHLRLTIVDSLAKRIRFLEEVAGQLQLNDVVNIHGRAEDIARLPAHRDRYAIVTARAVARLAGLNELCLPFARPDGCFIAMKGSGVTEEVEESRFSLQKLNAQLEEVKRLELPLEHSERHLVILRKNGPTPKAYPRKAGLPLKTPLLI